MASKLTRMAFAELPCRIRVEKVKANNKAVNIPIKDHPDIGIEIRKRWANELMTHFERTGNSRTSIRPWDFVAKMDGSLEALQLPAIDCDLYEGYPARFQIPSSTLRGLNLEAKVKRAEMFAMASLIYEIMSGREPFEELTDNEVQKRFMNGDIPDDAAALRNSLFMFSGWSEEFANESQKRGLPDQRLFSKASDGA